MNKSSSSKVGSVSDKLEARNEKLMPDSMSLSTLGPSTSLFDVLFLILYSTQKSVTNESASVVGGSLKLLVLLHFLLQANETQQDVLHLLLQANKEGTRLGDR